MVLINELTVEQINAALLHLQRSKDEVVGGNKGTTIQNISISNSGGGGNNVDYSSTIKNLATNIEKNKTAIEKNASDIAKLKSDFSKIEKSVEDTLQGLVDNGISDLSFDPLTKQLTITTNDGDTFQTTIQQDIGVLSYDSATNKLTLTTGNQSQEITLPYIKTSEKGSANGVATLDENGRVPYSQLPESAMEFLGQWDASTNTPQLADGTGTNGDFYIVSAGGTVNLGTEQNPHIVTFSINDRIVYEGDIAQWVRLPAGQVSSVNGQSGEVTLTANDIEYSTGVSIKAKIDANAVQADWNVSDTTSLAYIKNKPTIPASPVQSDWNVTDTTSLAYIKNKPTIPSNIVGIEDKGNNAWYPVAICTGTSCVGKSSGYGFSYNPGTGYLSPYGLSLGRGCCTESAGIINAQGTCNTNSMICFLNNTGDAYGNGVSIGGGGIVIVGAGESAGTVWCGVNGSSNLYGSYAGDETLYLASDNAIYLMANVQSGYACRKTASLGTVTENNVVYGVFSSERFCGELYGSASSLRYSSGVGCCVVQAFSCSGSFCGSESGWANYLVFSHGDGTSYYNQMIRFPFWSVPQYQRKADGVNSGWKDFITSENIASQNVYNAAMLRVAPSAVSCTTTANDYVGFAYTCYNNSNMPGTYGNVIQMQTGTGASSRWGYQVAFPTNGCLQYRRWTNTTSMGAWNSFITSENISSQHVACADHATSADNVTSLDWTDISATPTVGVIQKLGNTHLYKVYTLACCIQQCNIYSLLDELVHRAYCRCQYEEYEIGGIGSFCCAINDMCYVCNVTKIYYYYGPSSQYIALYNGNTCLFSISPTSTACRQLNDFQFITTGVK